jgi:Protein of unknown function (DUF3617)
MDMTNRSAFVAAVVLTAASLPAAAQTMQPGEWQFTSTMTSPMMPQPQTGVASRCVSKAEADDPASFIGGGNATGCVITRGPVSPGSYSWTMACEKQGVSGTGKATFDLTSIESEIRMTVSMQQGGQKVEMTNRTVGRYVGPCKSK